MPNCSKFGMFKEQKADFSVGLGWKIKKKGNQALIYVELTFKCLFFLF